MLGTPSPACATSGTVPLFLQLCHPIKCAGRESVFGMATHQSAINLYRPAEVSILFRLLRLREKLLRVAANFFLARRQVLGFFAGSEDHGASGRARRGAPDQGRKNQDAKAIFHRVAQGSYLTRPVKLAEAVCARPAWKSRAALQVYSWGRASPGLTQAIGALLPKRRFD